MRQRTSRAFTLVELLVVIGIIALLIAILMPALAKARDQAAKVKCASNLRQLGMVWQMFAQDHKGNYPTMQATAPVYANYPATGQNLKEALNSYVKSGWIFYCPTSRTSPTDPSSWDNPAGSGNMVIDYAILVGWKRMSGGVNKVVYTGPDAGLVEKVKRVPQNWVMMSDQAWSTGAAAAANPTWINHPFSRGGAQMYKLWKGMNELYYDGHVEWKRKEDVKLQANYANNAVNVFF